MSMLKKMTAGAAATLLFLASSSVFAEDDGDGAEGGGVEAAGGINIGSAVALGVLGIALIVESDDDGPSAPVVNRPDPVGPVTTGTGTISPSGT
jgi:hypothetical protein